MPSRRRVSASRRSASHLRQPTPRRSSCPPTCPRAARSCASSSSSSRPSEHYAGGYGARPHSRSEVTMAAPSPAAPARLGMMLPLDLDEHPTHDVRDHLLTFGALVLFLAVSLLLAR